MENRFKAMHFSQRRGGSMKADELSVSRGSSYSVTINSVVSREIISKGFMKATLWTDQLDGGYMLAFQKKGDLNVTKTGYQGTFNARILSKDLVQFLLDAFDASDETRIVLNMGGNIANLGDRLVFRLSKQQI